MAAPPAGPDSTSLTWFQPPPSEDKTQTSTFSLSGWFRKKDTQPSGKPANAPARPTGLSIRKSELEHKQEEEDEKAKEEGPRYRDEDGATRGKEHSQRGYPRHRTSSPLLYGGSLRRDSDQSPFRPRGAEQSVSGPVVTYTRSLTTVLKHLTRLIERKGQDPTTYSDSDFRQYWMPDSQCKECYDCGEKFTTFRRRHHCRLCGQIFCSRCCNQEVSGKFIGFLGNLRVCTYCCKVILSYAQSAYSSGDLKALQEDLKMVTEATTPSGNPLEGIMSPRKQMLGFMDEDQSKSSRAMSINSISDLSSSVFEVGPSLSNSTETQVSVVQERKLLDSAQLRDLWFLIRHPNNGIMFQNHRYRLRTYPECIIGSELVDWLIQKDKAAQRVQAVAIGQALLDAKWLKCVTSSYQTFHDEYALYSQGEAAEAYGNQTLPVPLDEKGENLLYGEVMEPSWFREIDQEEDPHSEDDLLVSSEGGQREATWEMMNSDPTVTGLTEARSPDNFGASPVSQPSPIIGSQHIPWSYEMPEPSLDQDPEQDYSDGLVQETLLTEANKLLVSFLDQQLRQEGLDMSWRDLILPLAKRICSMVKPNVMVGDSMDIRYYVHIKRVPGGTRAECSLFKGTICTKNVAHKKMGSKQTNPSILLLQAAIEHQRVQNKFASLEPLVLQEHEYLKNCVAKIVALKPTLLVVEKSVARLAQEFLMACDITLVLNVKPRVVSRIARHTEGASISTIDQVSTAKLGTCQSFYLQKYNLPGGYTKTLMFFDGCPGHLGCSVVLRGGSLGELSKVKRILNLMVYIVYHSRLETSFLKDEFALPPITSPLDVSPPYSPATPMSQTPSRQAYQDTGTIQEVLKAVRIEQALKRRSDDSSTECSGPVAVAAPRHSRSSKDGGDVIGATPPLQIKSGFKATMQKILMGKAKDGSDRSGNSSAAGSRRSSDGDISSQHSGDVTNAPGLMDNRSQDSGAEQPKKEGNDGDVQAGSASKPPGSLGEKSQRFSRAELDGNNPGSGLVWNDRGYSKARTSSPHGNRIREASEHVDSQIGGTRSDAFADEIANEMSRESGSSDSSNGQLLKDFVVLEDSNSNLSSSLDPLNGHSCIEISVKDGMVEKLTDLEEEDQVFSFDVTDTDSQADEAAETSEDDEMDNGSKTKDRFSTVYRDTLLNPSPFLVHPLPYLETEEGRHSPNRHFFTRDIYWSQKLLEDPSDETRSDWDKISESAAEREEVVYWSTDRCTHKIRSIKVLDPHPFTFVQLTEDSLSDSARTLLADFRARGGRYTPKERADTCMPAQKTSVEFYLDKPNSVPNVPSQQYLLARKGDVEVTSSSNANRPIYDCFDPYLHQKILLQFSSYSHHSGNMPGHCINPWIVTMEFYGRNDITLGMFLEKYCFNSNYYCPSENCDTLMANHVRRFVHGNASIQVLQRKLDSPVPGYSNKVLMWSWCRKCKQVTPVQPMSRDTWHMSFAKYLDIRFHGKDFGRRGSSSPCTHSLHHHHYQYFGQHNMVASFKYNPIILREIAFPPMPIEIDKPYRAHANYVEESQKVASRASQVLRGIHGNISSLTAPKPNQQMEQKQHEFLVQYEADVARFKQCMDDLETKISQAQSLLNQGENGPDCDIPVEDQLLDIEDSIVITKRVICETIFAWNERFHDFLLQKEKEKQRKKDNSGSSRKTSSDTDGGTPTLPRRSESVPVFITASQSDPSTSKQGSLESNKTTGRLTTLHERKKDEMQGRERVDSDVSMLGDPRLTYDEPKSYDLGISPGLNAGLEYKPERLTKFTPRGSLNFQHGSLTESGCLAPSASSPALTPVFTTAFMASDDDCEDSVEVSKELKIEESGEVNKTEAEGKTEEALAVSKTEPSPSPVATGDSASIGQSSQPQPPVDVTDSKGSNKTKPGAVKQILNQFLQPADSSHIETPFPADQHHTLPPCSIVPVVVYDQEPSSIIAYALSSEQYRTKLYEKQQSYSGSGRLSPGGASLGSGQGSSTPGSGQTSPHTRRKFGGETRTGGGMETIDLSRKIGQLKRKLSEGMLKFQRTRSVGGGLSTMPSLRDDGGPISIIVESQEDDAEDKLTSDDKNGDQVTPHISLRFSDQTNTQFFCGVYFAEQFQELRKLVFPVGEDVYIRCLSRCMQWVARGGKSGSKFMKTLDDRLILKQMSKSEAHSFIKFAPHYFSYVQQAHNSNKPTALAKILGFYKLGFHNPITNTAQKLDLLVQENLFYKRRIAQVFDLKGSMRNRHVKTLGVQTQDLVLMDENLLKHMVDSPLYIRLHSKTALAVAIKADTEFLSSHLVMDYSLLVGLDENSKELVIGIIDFIRTFTWDKKLETFVKSTSGKMPTVVSPELYRSRFLEAMSKYFLMVPDRWTGLGKDAYSDD